MNTSKFSQKRNLLSRARSGMSLVETLVSSSLLVIISAGLLTMTLEAAKSQSRALVEATMNQEADLLQDRLLDFFRNMSASESVIFSSPVSSNSRIYHNVICAKGEAPTFNREQLTYNISNGTILHDPDRTSQSEPVIYYRPEINSDYPKLQELYFFASLKVGGIPDGSKLNIYFELSDEGYAGLKNSSGNSEKMIIARSFTVKMRN
jgi:Tfp pilus assembly protein PilV